MFTFTWKQSDVLEFEDFKTIHNCGKNRMKITENLYSDM